ncbi:hypothetical protein EAF64_04045 [Halorientalis pallida]|uniref:Uncharacterized protein n=1 Tax=Halorientalis pallida TaxID=2479928 RepID=A0A498L5U6_9EURY|nr:hypothetical protein EAF64_04045 [Halorientalis pallida]
MKNLYDSLDEWIRGLSQERCAVLLAVSRGLGVLGVGLLLFAERFLLRALTMALVLFGLEYTFGLHQTHDGD